MWHRHPACAFKVIIFTTETQSTLRRVLKSPIGKLPLPEPLDSYISSRMAELGVQLLDIKANHAVKASSLPLHHRDPFDRMLIAQAIIENMTLVTADSIFKQYDVYVL